jgi:hypothetical protein
MLLVGAAAYDLAESIKLALDVALTIQDPLLDGAQRHMIESTRSSATNLR